MKTGQEWAGRGDQRGFNFRVARSSLGVLLLSKENLGEVEYEVVIVRKRPKDVYLSGKLIAKEGSEYLPRSSEWGGKGWSYMTKEAAMVKFKEMTRRQAEKGRETK